MENLNREEELEAIRNSSFDSVSIDEFFDNASQKEDDIIQTGIIVFTDHQQKLIDRLSSALAQNASDRVDRLQSRLTDVTNLAKAIAYFPSLLERANTTTSTRTPEALCFKAQFNAAFKGNSWKRLPCCKDPHFLLNVQACKELRKDD